MHPTSKVLKSEEAAMAGSGKILSSVCFFHINLSACSAARYQSLIST
jgi:hypothetical protein